MSATTNHSDPFDCFALLGEPRRPWLEAEALKTRFLTLSATTHPDRFHSAPEAEKAAANARFQSLNAAYNCLRDPKERLQHLLTLERGMKPAEVHAILPGTADLFLEVGQLCRGVDAFLAEKDRATAPLLKAQLFQQAAVWSGRIATFQQKISAQRATAEEELRALDAAWQTGARPFDALEQLFHRLSYLTRWQQQLQERFVRLAL